MSLSPRSPIPTAPALAPSLPRRGAIGGMIAAAVGAVGIGAASRGEVSTAKTAKPIAAPPSRTDLGYDDGDEPLTPALARLKAESQAILLPAAWEVSDSL